MIDLFVISSPNRDIEDLCNKFSISQPVYFTQNDDHIFVDDNDYMLQEGLELLAAHKTEFKTIYLSHWPEVLKLSGKENLQKNW